MSEDFTTRQDFFTTQLPCLCIETGHVGHFQWEFDDELEVSVTLEQTRFKYIKDEEGKALDEDDLDQIADYMLSKRPDYERYKVLKAQALRIRAETGETSAETAPA